MDKRKINLAKFRFEKAEEELEISKTLFDKGYYRASQVLIARPLGAF